MDRMDTQLLEAHIAPARLRDAEGMYDTEDWAWLRESILECGIEEPIIVGRGRGGRWHVLDGAHRLRCALDLGIATVPVEIIEPAGEKELIEWEAAEAWWAVAYEQEEIKR